MVVALPAPPDRSGADPWAASLTRTVPSAGPLDLRRTLAPLRRGIRDRCLQMHAGVAWRATWTPEGPVTTRLHVDARAATAVGRAWGPGAVWALDHLPELVGAADDDGPLRALLTGPGTGHAHRVVARLAGQLTGLRLTRTRAVAEALVPTILEQKVTGLEAKRSWRELVDVLGAPAPGPAGAQGLRLPPTAVTLSRTPSWVFHRCGVERKRADTITRAASVAGRLDACVDLPRADAYRRLTSLPGVGAWSAAEVAGVALGDPDAVSVGDYHLPDQVAWALAGRPRGDDALMLELLEPFRGQRGRVLRLLVAGGVQAPRYGPRMTVRSIRHY